MVGLKQFETIFFNANYLLLTIKVKKKYNFYIYHLFRKIMSQLEITNISSKYIGITPFQYFTPH